MTTRKQLLNLEHQKEDLNTQIQKLKNQYVEENENKPLIFISDHAIYRYLERIENINLGAGDETELVSQYIKDNNIVPKKMREAILSLEEQKQIMLNNLTKFHKNDFIYIIKNLSLVTIYSLED